MIQCSGYIVVFAKRIMSKMYLFLFSKGGAFMCFIESILTFISDGISTLKDTIHGRYGLQTEEARKMREDIFF